MSYFRLALIPVFVWLYLAAEETQDYYIAAVVLAVSALTDLFDGKIARKFNQITELGKFIDPLADKLTHGAVIVCLINRFPIVWMLLGVYIIKEGFMGVMGLIILKHNGEKLDGAMWYGKVCTAILFIVMVAMLLFPNLPPEAVTILVCVCSIVMLLAFIMYVPVFVRMYNK